MWKSCKLNSLNFCKCQTKWAEFFFCNFRPCVKFWADFTYWTKKYMRKYYANRLILYTWEDCLAACGKWIFGTLIKHLINTKWEMENSFVYYTIKLCYQQVHQFLAPAFPPHPFTPTSFPILWLPQSLSAKLILTWVHLCHQESGYLSFPSDLYDAPW